MTFLSEKLYNKRMRMRRKSRLDERISECGEHLLITEGEDFYKKIEQDRYDFLDFEKIFANNNPIMLEIGCGKGGFAFKIAERYQDVNFIAVEKISNVIIEACEKADREKPKNLRFMNIAAENLPYYVKSHTISRIYLNFSCPYPKYTYRNRRLTYYRFLNIYKELLTQNGEIHLKTDNRGFFEFSIQSFSENGFILKNISLDLHSEDLTDNVETEYEKMFVAEGRPIYKLEAYLR